MPTVKRPNRKASDAAIVRMNGVGLSLATIARLIGCHPTSVTLRLQKLGIDPADTRRAFMEDIFVTLDPDQREWLADKMETGSTCVKNYVRELIVDDYQRNHVSKPSE